MDRGRDAPPGPGGLPLKAKNGPAGGVQRLLQLTLDLFGDGPTPAVPAAPARPGGPRAPGTSAGAKGLEPLPGTAALPPLGNSPLPLPPGAGAAPGGDPALRPAPGGADGRTLVFTHPRASREIVLGDARIAYAFDRGHRRTIGFSVGTEGLAVRAPRWAAIRDVEAALHEKANWILRKLSEARQREARQEAGRIAWCDGAQLPFLGRLITLRLDPTDRQAGAGGLLDVGDGSADAPQLLRLALSPDVGEARIRDAAQAWLTRQARRVFTERLAHFAPQLGVQWTKLSLSNAATRWGSASADGSIRLNWRLIHYRLPIIDYVVVHELAHLRVMDHSPRFWDEVGRVLPDYAQRRQVLKDEPAPRWG